MTWMQYMDHCILCLWLGNWLGDVINRARGKE